MVQAGTAELTDFFRQVQEMGKLRTPAHAQRWTTAVLKTLALNLDRGTKNQLARALPPPLAEPLTRVFWLLHFRNSNLSSYDFQKEVAKRSGHTDAHFARFPILAVFHGLKELVDPQVSKYVAQSLSPEVRELWQQA